jgi:WD40 repeat protein
MRHTERVSEVEFSPDAKKLATMSNEKDQSKTHLWDATTGAALQASKWHDDPVFTMAFSTDVTILAYGSGR